MMVKTDNLKRYIFFEVFVCIKSCKMSINFLRVHNSSNSDKDGDKKETKSVQVDLEETKKTSFRDEVRRVFLEQWMTQDGDWLSTLDEHHLNFLRDLLGIEVRIEEFTQ